jgi:hypothetical protein
MITESEFDDEFDIDKKHLIVIESSNEPTK